MPKFNVCKFWLFWQLCLNTTAGLTVCLIAVLIKLIFLFCSSQQWLLCLFIVKKLRTSGVRVHFYTQFSFHKLWPQLVSLISPRVVQYWKYTLGANRNSKNNTIQVQCILAARLQPGIFSCWHYLPLAVGVTHFKLRYSKFRKVM